MISKGRMITARMSGSFCCRNDLDLTLINESSELEGLTGFAFNGQPEEQLGSLRDLIRSEYWDKIRSEISAQLAECDEVEETFPAVCKDGTVKWLMCRGGIMTGDDGQEYLSGILMDITKSKQKYDAQKKTLGVYQIILSQTENVIFEWDCISDAISFSRAWEKLFGYAPQLENVTAVLNNGVTFHPEDVKQLLHQLQIMQEGSAYQNIDIRIYHADGEYKWCRLRATGIFDDSTGKLLKVVGVIIDIDDEMKATRALQEQAETDSLSGLLNATTARKRAEEYLATCVDEYCALLVLDLDKFKQINDQLGHMQGDEVLVQVAENIRKRFRSQDIVGRIGGDEFMVLMKDVPNEELVEVRCGQLVDAIREIYKEKIPDMQAGCSVGAVMVKADGMSYSQLFAKADQAMYMAKEKGRNQYAFFRNQHL